MSLEGDEMPQQPAKDAVLGLWRSPEGAKYCQIVSIEMFTTCRLPTDEGDGGQQKSMMVPAGSVGQIVECPKCVSGLWKKHSGDWYF